ncbi:ArsR/SmtB family transcription factor [Leptospira levettii]|uniref:ArsR/SmtB family transcription factor n=1 Tax=Leptospira levettii TaxID=2023178 RepID=UPI000C29E638|nr:helix-turn-helix transcriptional regulator [Leptospira levettii]PKA26893.1 transcriptional regulator [Leptospira sp. mixed culture ATI2-C-A1]TGM28254.1 transcriptional regulator [Leptospira levettii]
MNSFLALGDDTRREIILLVAKNGEMTSTAISKHFSISAPAISQHLQLLRELQLLNVKKEAQKRIYSVNLDGFSEMEELILKVREDWSKRLNSLERYALKLKKGKTI